MHRPVHGNCEKVKLVSWYFTAVGTRSETYCNSLPPRAWNGEISKSPAVALPGCKRSASSTMLKSKSLKSHVLSFSRK